MADAATTGSRVRNQNAFTITPGATEFTVNTRRIYVGVSGHLVIVTPEDDEVVLQNVPVGFIELQAKKVLATSEASGSPNYSTTAGALIGFY